MRMSHKRIQKCCPRGKFQIPLLAVNEDISKEFYLESKISLTFPRVDDLVEIMKRNGRQCLLFKRDLKRAYRQIPVDPGDVSLLGYYQRQLEMAVSKAY